MDLNKLKQEAEEYGKKATAWLEDREPLDQRDIENAYLAGAEPREKQITGLSKHILELQKDKGNLIDRCKELEKRCANYEMTISKMEKGTCDICKETEKDKKIEGLEAQIEKLIDFVLSKTECCDVCPITDTCINSEGTCPYAGILAKGEEEVTREWLMQFISKEIKEK